MAETQQTQAQRAGRRPLESQRVRVAAEQGIQAARPTSAQGRGRDGGADAGEQALAQTTLIGDDVVKSIEAMIAEIDKKLTEQINLILHHEEFQKLEGAWRGLHYLVNNTETDEMLKIRVMNISKKDLRQDAASKYKGTAWDQSPLFKKIYEEEYGQFGGEPYGCLVGDYYFDHSAARRRAAGRDGARSRPRRTRRSSPARRPTLMQMESWQELANPRDLTKIFTTPEYAAWRSLRESEDARYIGLAHAALPGAPALRREDRTRSRSSTSRRTPAGADHNKYTWANAAYAMAVNINRSFKLYGWCSRIRGIESGGAVEGLPTHTFPTDDGGVDMKCPTEIAISDRREAELAKNGFMPLIHRKNSDFAAFIGAQSLQKPAEYDDPDATANANLAARLPYLFAMLPLRALPEVHRARQDRLVQGARRHAALAAGLDHATTSTAIRRTRAKTTKAQQAAGRRRGGGRRGRGQPRLLHVEVLPAAALPARRADRVAAAGVEAAVGQGR